MRFLLAILLTALFAGILQLLGPWHMAVVAAFIMVPAFKLKRSFLAGFLGVFLLWIVVGLVRDVSNGHLLSSRLAQIFFVGEGYLFLLVSALIGGLASGLGAWSGSLLWKAIGTESTGKKGTVGKA